MIWILASIARDIIPTLFNTSAESASILHLAIPIFLSALPFYAITRVTTAIAYAQNKDGKQFKSKRKNAKLETDKLCPQNSDEDKKLYSQGTDYTRGVCCSAREILETFERKG